MTTKGCKRLKKHLKNKFKQTGGTNYLKERLQLKNLSKQTKKAIKNKILNKNKNIKHK